MMVGDIMKVKDLIQRLLDMDRNYEITISEFYPMDEQQMLRVDHEIVGHIVDDDTKQVIFLIPNKDGKIGNESI
jgi:hypothetical protein